MRTWTVEGADAKTGDDRVLSIEALDRAEAEREARARGLLVSAVHERLLADRKPGAHAGPPLPPSAAKIPDYRDLLAGVTLLRIFGWLAVVGAAAWLAVMIRMFFETYRFESKDHYIVSPFADALGAAVPALLNAMSCLVVAILLRLFASCAIALRDIARNSFTKPTS